MLRATVLISLLPLCAPASVPCDFEERLPVRLFNDAEVHHDVIRRATEEAAWLLQSVCVAIEWVPCTTVSVSHPESCTLAVPSIEMHLLPSPTTSDVEETVLGIAFPRLGTRGNAAVFLSHIRQLV